MNKKNAIGLVLAAVLVFSGCGGQGNGKQSQNKNAASPPAGENGKIPGNNAVPSSETEKSPEQVVGEYYISIIDYLNKKISADNSLNPSFVTPKIVNSYNKAKKAPANPFLCAQDYPDDASKLSVTLVKKDDFSAKYKVIVFTNWPPISVSLIKEEGKWKINEISCSNGNKL